MPKKDHMCNFQLAPGMLTHSNIIMFSRVHTSVILQFVQYNNMMGFILTSLLLFNIHFSVAIDVQS